MKLVSWNREWGQRECFLGWVWAKFKSFYFNIVGSSLCCYKTAWTGVAWTVDMCFSQFWKLRCIRARCSQRPFLAYRWSLFLPVSSYSGQRKRGIKFSGVPPYKRTWSIMKASPSWPHLNSGPPKVPHSIIMGLWASAGELREHNSIHSRW